MSVETIDYELEGEPPIAGVLVDAVTEWRGEIYAAQAGCIWVLRDDWRLADGENMPPSFPPRRQHTDSPSEAEG